MTPLSELVKSHILKALIHEVKVLQEVMSHLVRKKGVCEGLINMLSPQVVVASSSQAVILDVQKDVVITCQYEDMSSADEEDGVKYETSSNDDSPTSSQ